ncbi:MAG TPA: RsmG family class I SAM-dependent methyltransferase [Polyangiaceae bacterium]|nr:RsmG family class I SAM-dependent methyltransferase [Polyangiaceae bacterium]
MPGALLPLGEGFRPLISAVLRGLRATSHEPVVTEIVTWLDLLATWNAKIDLTAARSAEELVDLMVADAVVLARHEASGAAMVDVGSGAGGPGLALGLLRPDLNVTLVEPLAKRVSFLRTVLGHLATAPKRAGTLQVIRGKGEDLAARGEVFDSAVARATLPPSAWLDLGGRMVRPGGAVCVLLAREPAPETTDWKIETEERYTWPLTGVERRALRYRRAP